MPVYQWQYDTNVSNRQKKKKEEDMDASENGTNIHIFGFSILLSYFRMKS